jgi:hypothetical protein
VPTTVFAVSIIEEKNLQSAKGIFKRSAYELLMFNLTGAVTLSITTLSIMTLSIMTLSIMTLSITTLSIMTLSIMTLSIMTLSITTFGIILNITTLPLC